MRSEVLAMTAASLLGIAACRAEEGEAVRQMGGLWGPEGLGKTDRLMPLVSFPPLSVWRTISFDELEVQPGADITFLDNHLELHPKVIVGTGYNTNVGLTEGAEASPVFTYGAGLDGVLALDPNTRITLLSYVGFQQFTADHSADLADYQASLDLAHWGDWLSYKGGGFIERNNNADPSTGERIPHVIGGGRASTSTTGGTAGTALGLRIEQTVYLDDGVEFTAASRENIYGEISGGLNHRFASGLVASMGLGYGERHYRSTVDFNDSDSTWLTIGGFARLASRSTLSVKVGPGVRVYSADFHNDPAYNDKVVPWLVGASTLQWQWNHNAFLVFQANSGLSDGVSSNAVHTWSADIRQIIYPQRNWYVGGLLGASYNENSGAPADEQVGRRTYSFAGLEALVGLHRGVDLHWSGIVNNQSVSGVQGVGIETGVQLAVVF